MSARALMLLGAFVIAIAAVIDIFQPGIATVVVGVGGALFGKGYGIFEERSRNLKGNSNE